MHTICLPYEKNLCRICAVIALTTSLDYALLLNKECFPSPFFDLFAEVKRQTGFLAVALTLGNQHTRIFMICRVASEKKALEKFCVENENRELG